MRSRKSALFSGTLKYQAFHGAPIHLAEGPAYSVQPATSPTADGWNTANSGTEYFMSALDFDAYHRQPDRAVGDDEHEVAERPDADRDADRADDRLERDVRAASERRAEEGPDHHSATQLGEHEEQVATNDDRMNQVVYADGKLWSAVNTVVRTSNGASSSTDRSGIAYFVVSPSTPTAHVGGRLDREPGLCRARQQRQRVLPVDRRQRRRQGRDDVLGVRTALLPVGRRTRRSTR